ncbi:MBL fold metallo-hydrolase [Pseudovibrio flavus]|uniref:MBL fold metallo-hydrolase n=1 Tax=Pseudovibrio flavus TaxID=2529854 RepID=UPI00211D021F|nr:MBL fold metallo-hydrolase [Pseudovibrio flavus]
MQVAPPPRVDGSLLRVTAVGHATYLLQLDGLNILTDPVWAERAGPFSIAGPKRISQPGIAFQDLPKIDVVLLSHNHYDHMDLPTLAKLWHKFRPKIVTPLGNGALLKGQDKAIECYELDWDETLRINDECSVTLLPTQHWSSRNGKDRCAALWGGFGIKCASGSIYFAGDTGFGKGYPFIRAAEQMGPIDVALLPIGAYEPRWFMEFAHMNPEEAVSGFNLLGARYAVGYHFGTFKLTNEPIDEPVARLHDAVKKQGISPKRFRALLPAQHWDISLLKD